MNLRWFTDVSHATELKTAQKMGIISTSVVLLNQTFPWDFTELAIAYTPFTHV